MVVVSILPHPEFGPNDHREDALHFRMAKKPLCLHTYPVHINCKVVYIHFLFPFVNLDRIQMQDFQIRFD